MASDVAYDYDGALTRECRKVLTRKRAALRRKIAMWKTTELSELPTLAEVSDLVKAIMELDVHLNDDTNASKAYDDKIRSIKASILEASSPSPVKGIVETEAIETTASRSPSLSFSHRWTFDNFAHLYDENCQWKWNVESEEFSPPDIEGLKFSLKILPKEKGEDGEEYLALGFNAHQMPTMWEGKVTLQEKCSLVDEEGKELFRKEYPERNVLTGAWAFDLEYLPVVKLRDSSAGYLKGGTLRIQCEMTLHSPEAIFTLPGNAHTFSTMTIPSSVSSLSHSFTLSHFKWLCEDSTRQMPLRVESEYFAPQRKDIGKLSIMFYPKGDKGNDEENVLMVITNENTNSLNVHWEYFLSDAKGDKCHQKENTNRMLPKSGRSYLLPRRLLLSLLDSLPTDELTINCHVTVLGKREQKKAPFHTTPTTTHFDLALFNFHYVSFTWTIEQFLEKRHKQLFNSKHFSPSNDSRYEFTLRLYPNKDKKKATFSLCFVSPSSLEESKVDCRYSVVDAMEDEWNVGVRTFLISNPAQFGPYDLIPHRTLTNFASFLLPEGKLTIKCELWIHEPHKELPSELRNPPQTTDSISGSHFVVNSPELLCRIQRELIC